MPAGRPKRRELITRPGGAAASAVAITFGVLILLGGAKGAAQDTVQDSVQDSVQDNSIREHQTEAMPLDAFGYLGGLIEARFYEPHATTGDPRDEIRQEGFFRELPREEIIELLLELFPPEPARLASLIERDFRH